MHPHLPGCHPHGSCIGKPRCTQIYPSASNISPMWANPDAPISTRMLHPLVPCGISIWVPSGISTLLHPAFTWVPSGKAQMYPQIPGCHPHKSHVGEPRCTHNFPDATHIGAMWAMDRCGCIWVCPQWTYVNTGCKFHIGPMWKSHLEPIPPSIDKWVPYEPHMGL